MSKILTLIISVFFLMQTIAAQVLNPVAWTFSETDNGGGQRELVWQASIERGWHIYGHRSQNGIVATSVHIREMRGARLAGKLAVESSPQERYDAQFAKKLTLIENQITFRQKVLIENPSDYLIDGYVRYMACNDKQCLSPVEEPFTFGQNSSTDSEAVDIVSSAVSPFAFNLIDEPPVQKTGDSLADNPLWQPVQTAADDALNNDFDFGELLVIFLQGLLGGLLALFTPCVWPIIPFTMSFFLKRSGNRRKGLRDALLYGASIIVIYLGLGLLVTLAFGASALNSLSTNAFFNLFFFALLVVFGISFLGAFNIVLPSSWSNRVDSQAEQSGGVWGIFLMAFTLALVSFSCTGPIIGTLLVAVSVEGSYLAPAVGMFGFALALAVPFALFALFPSILRSLPKSGGWLNTVKVSIGFLELALALKFLSVADLAYGWHILDREVFVAIWIVVFALWGLYLLGKLRLPHDSVEPQRTGIVRLGLAMASFAFALYLLPGLWGAPLKAISAFAPPLSTQDFSLYKNEVHAHYNDYDLGMDYARRVNKNVLVDFSGFGCVNCRKMEASVWTDAEVSQRLKEDFVLITLFVDDKTALPEPIEITEGKTRTLRTVGDKWSYLQRHKFKTNQQPYYVILDTEGNLLAPPIAYTESVQEFLDFLDSAEK